MTNMIKASDLTIGTRIEDAAGVAGEVTRILRLEHKIRIDTTAGTILALPDNTFHLAE